MPKSLLNLKRQMIQLTQDQTLPKGGGGHQTATMVIFARTRIVNAVSRAACCLLNVNLSDKNKTSFNWRAPLRFTLYSIWTPTQNDGPTAAPPRCMAQPHHHHHLHSVLEEISCFASGWWAVIVERCIVCCGLLRSRVVVRIVSRSTRWLCFAFSKRNSDEVAAFASRVCWLIDWLTDSKGTKRVRGDAANVVRGSGILLYAPEFVDLICGWPDFPIKSGSSR